MATVTISPERKAQLEEYAQRIGLDTDGALDLALAEYLAWERTDFNEAVEGIREGYEDILAGRTQPVDVVFEELRVKHGFPR